METACVSKRKVWATLGEYAPNPLGYTRAAMLHTMRCNLERESQSLKCSLVQIEACNPAS